MHVYTQVKDLEEAAAFARGADFLSEAFVFIVGGTRALLCGVRSIPAPQANARRSLDSHPFTPNPQAAS